MSGVAHSSPISRGIALIVVDQATEYAFKMNCANRFRGILAEGAGSSEAVFALPRANATLNLGDQTPNGTPLVLTCSIRFHA